MTTKFHLAITADGHLIEGFLTAGNVCDITVANELTKNVVGCDVFKIWDMTRMSTGSTLDRTTTPQ